MFRGEIKRDRRSDGDKGERRRQKKKYRITYLLV